ncbi:MAG: hypothetical protein K6F11_08170 [Lachnospiraceae bacterium]|nr:hypothetical protein [Lachnospiraceae bacterium]
MIIDTILLTIAIFEFFVILVLKSKIFTLQKRLLEVMMEKHIKKIIIHPGLGEDGNVIVKTIGSAINKMPIEMTEIKDE